MDAIKGLYRTPDSYKDYEMQVEKMDPYPVKQAVIFVAKRALIDLAISLTFLAATAYFVTPGGVMTLLTVAITTVAINSLLRGTVEYARYHVYKSEFEGSEPSFCLESLVDCSQYLPGFAMGVYYTMTTDIVIHEGGHALAAIALYENPHPKIEITPLSGGETSTRSSRLNQWGAYFGAKRSDMIVTAAGAGLSTLSVVCNIGIGFKLWRSNPEASSYFFWMAALTVVQNTGYALSAFCFSKDTGHDFISLWAKGVNPFVSASITLGVPVLMFSICLLLKYYRPQPSTL